MHHLDNDTRASRYLCDKKEVILNHSFFVFLCTKEDAVNPSAILSKNSPWQKVHCSRVAVNDLSKQREEAVKLALECAEDTIDMTKINRAWVVEQPLPPSLPEQAADSKSAFCFDLDVKIN